MRSHITDFLALLVAVAGIGLVTPLFVSPLSAEGEITITDLGSLTNDSYGESMAWDINPLGLMIVGGSKTDLGLRHAVLWERSESVWAIQDLGPTSGTSVYALGINEHRQVVGDLNGHAALWEESGNGWTVQNLPTIGRISMAHDINAHGQIVGNYIDSDMHAALWEDSGSGWAEQDLGKYYNAIGINDLGQIVGYYENYPTKYAVLWERSGTGWDIQALPTLGGDSMANDINALGQIVGWSFTGTGERHAVLWEKSGSDWVVQKLPDIGDYGSWGAEGINDFGQIVGSSYYFVDIDITIGHAALWEKACGEWKVKDLDPLGSDSGASAINNLGQIVGSSYTSGSQHATLWTVSVENQPPTAKAGPDQNVTATGGTSTVTLDGSFSCDPDSDTLTYSWTENGIEIATGEQPSVSLEVGIHNITLTVSDPYGLTSTDEVTVTTVSALDITAITVIPRKNKAIAVTVLIRNPGETTAYNVTVTAAWLDEVYTNSALPLVYGAIKPFSSKQCTLQFKFENIPSDGQTLTIQGTSSLGDFFTTQ